MLSSGKYHLDVPRKPEDNLDFRRYLLDWVGTDPIRQAAMVQACSEDLLFYVNAWCWTYDPELDNKVIPFITWPAQEKSLYTILECMEDRRDLVIEKSRRQGGSWLSILSMEWLWHFREWHQFLMISRDAKMVDGHTPDSLFWKIDFLHKYQPRWLLPQGYGPANRLQMYFENPVNGSTITGQATSSKAGVGGRAYAMFVDEFSRIDEDQEVLDSTADTSRCRIFNSTHTGPGTAFFRLTESATCKKLRLHWSENPTCNAGLYRYDLEEKRVTVLDHNYDYPEGFNFILDGKLRSPWYDHECERRGNSRAIAMDLDIDARGSMSQYVDPQMIRTLIAIYATDPYWRGDMSVDAEAGKCVALVPAPGGTLCLWCHLRAADHNPDLRSPPLGTYAIGGDIAAGSGATPSCLSVVNCHTGQKVAEYANPHIDPKSLGPVAVALARLFCNEDGDPAKLIWEQQGPGGVFGGAVLALNFGNIYYRTTERPYSVADKVSQNPGWVPNRDNTLVLLDDYRAALYSRQFVNRSKAALEEFYNFRYNERGDVEHAAVKSENDPTGARANHGDRVIADALAWKMAKDKYVSPRKKLEQMGPPVLSLEWRREFHRKRELQEAEW